MLDFLKKSINFLKKQSPPTPVWPRAALECMAQLTLELQDDLQLPPEIAFRAHGYSLRCLDPTAASPLIQRTVCAAVVLAQKLFQGTLSETDFWPFVSEYFQNIQQLCHFTNQLFLRINSLAFETNFYQTYKLLKNELSPCRVQCRLGLPLANFIMVVQPLQGQLNTTLAFSILLVQNFNSQQKVKVIMELAQRLEVQKQLCWQKASVLKKQIADRVAVQKQHQAKQSPMYLQSINCNNRQIKQIKIQQKQQLSQDKQNKQNQPEQIKPGQRSAKKRMPVDKPDCDYKQNVEPGLRKFFRPIIE